MKRAFLLLPIGLSASLAFAVFPDKPTTGYRAVGMIGSTSTGAFKLSGSGVAIAPQWVIGVSHVGGTVFVQGGRHYPIEKKTIHKVTTGEPADLALYKLSKPVTAYMPILFAPYDSATGGIELKGRTAFLVGFGRTAKLRGDGIGWDPVTGSEGVKRVATNRLDRVSTERYNIGTDLDPKYKSTVCLGYDIDKPGDPSFSTLGSLFSDSEGGAAARDSGGGWFVNVGGANYLVAVSATVGRPENSLLPTDYSYGAMGFGVHLYNYRGWIRSVTGMQELGANPSLALLFPWTA